MNISGVPKLELNQEAKSFINLYQSLGERAENFLPDRIFESLSHFVRLCYEEADDPNRQQLEINKMLINLKEAIPGYVDVSLMIFPHEDSKAFEYSSQRQAFVRKLNYLMDIEAVNDKQKQQLKNILKAQNFSVGTPPVTQNLINFMYSIILGDKVRELRKFRDVIGVSGYVEEAQWNYMLDVMDQMVVQSTHYTTKKEIQSFLARSESTVNFKGLNGFIRTLVSGTSETAIKLIKEEIFQPELVRVIEYENPDFVFDQISEDTTSIFIIKAQHMRKNPLNDFRWFPLLTRMIFVDSSPESYASNTCLVFAFHNDIINNLNKVHTKKLGAPANSQMNLRLILDKVNTENLTQFRIKAEAKIKDYEEELKKIKKAQNARLNNQEEELALYKFDEFSQQIVKDKYILSKLAAFISFIEGIKDPEKHQSINDSLLNEFESRMKSYFYADSDDIELATIVEGGGRNQIKTYGEFLLKNKVKPVKKEVAERCKVILDVLPNVYERTLQNHFHKNFGLNLFLEKYKKYLTKAENEANNSGRFRNLLLDLGIEQKYNLLNEKEQQIIKDFIAGLGNQDKTSISDDVQMIVRDLILNHDSVKPFIFLNQQAAWEYKDLFPIEKFDMNPFDIDIELDELGRIDYDRFLTKLQRIKSSLQLFDESGSLWDHFCSNATILINDPSNPTGYSDFNEVSLIKFLKFVSNTQFTLFLDEAYNDSVKIEDPNEPKWRTISNYVINNMASYARISMVASLSTTKNLGATGDRLGALAVTEAKKDLIKFIRAKSEPGQGNSNSLFFLVNILETAQQAKRIKSMMDKSLPKDASRHKIKNLLENFIYSENKNNTPQNIGNGDKIKKRESLFEGSPLYIFVLNELLSLDKLDVLELPDDFKYKGEAFFSYYQKHLVFELNQFRVNRIFRTESGKRLKMAKEIADKLVQEEENQGISYLHAEGAYLFNFSLGEFFSYLDLELFAKELAKYTGIAAIPYQTGFVRFSLGDYVEGTEKSYEIFKTEIETGFRIFLKYWNAFARLRSDNGNKGIQSEDLLKTVFPSHKKDMFIASVLNDFEAIKDFTKRDNNSLRISEIKTMYHAFPHISGVSINSIGDSKNAVFEFYESVGHCANVTEFINSQAFSKIYENLLPQIYKKIPAIKHLDINQVNAKYGKPTILKYVNSKLDFQPNSHILDDPDEMLIMLEILIELESILFSDAKVKMLALKANEKDTAGDLARLEGYNQILRKYIKEILLHFNLPFEQELKEPSVKEMFYRAITRFEEITKKSCREISPVLLINKIVEGSTLANNNLEYSDLILASLSKRLTEISRSEDYKQNILSLYLNLVTDIDEEIEQEISFISQKLEMHDEADTKLFAEKLIDNFISRQLRFIESSAHLKIDKEDIKEKVREMVLFITTSLNDSKQTNYYERYNHILIKLLRMDYLRQNSFRNEMIQHGFTIYKDFNMDGHILESHDEGKLSWINEVMKQCGVIAAEQPVQTHTRMNTDAKKREYPFHKIDRIENEDLKQHKESGPGAFIKNLSTRPDSEFFADRLSKFTANMDHDDYRCRIVKGGLVNELYIFQKSYMKYMADNFRLINPQAVSLRETKNFVPDIILFLGAPEKVISYPQIGYFDLDGPKGKIKTIVTPLKKRVDYFGDVKKPRLTMLNEKVKEMGGAPVHGSFFVVEGDDGSLFGMMISGDSGVGKSEMLAAMQLQWLKRDLTGIRSIKLVAGDMLHLFPDTEGNLYGVGTEVGDFSRVTDFDPEYIRQYITLFESSADSNVEDLNSRSTISGFCDISMPFKVDIMLTAHNYSKDEAGITKYSNAENYMLYRDAHGERKEKATSEDGPNFQRTFLRYTGDKNIVEVLDTHGNYLDQVLDWHKEESNGRFYLCSSYKMIDKIDIEEVVNKIFIDKEYKYKDTNCKIDQVRFDIIKNKFIVYSHDLTEEAKEHQFYLDRRFFNSLFNSLASTPGGNPFIDEHGELEIRKNLIKVLKGGENGEGKGKNIQCGILSTDLGKKGKEISGPAKAASDVKKLIQEVRNANPELHRTKDFVKKEIDKHYGHLYLHHKKSLEVDRYNFSLYQLDQMRKARFVRIDDEKKSVDLSMLDGFKPLPKTHEFSPLLVTPNMNIELNNFSETYEQLMWLPNNKEFAEEFYKDCDKIYIANGYTQETIINNMIVQLLLLNGYIAVDELSNAKITEKANRETIAAAKYAVVRKLRELEEQKEQQSKKKPTNKK